MASERVTHAAHVLFGADATAVIARLAALDERVALGVLRVSAGDPARLEEALALATLDWRDLLVEAGFADDLEAHHRWEPTR